VLVHDAQHLASQFPDVAYLGHASVEYAVALAREAGAATLALFHHSPTRTDDEIDEIMRAVPAEGSPNVLAAYEGLELEVGRG
jgi:ribonuclease BN (tRNA processing enzyme)